MKRVAEIMYIVETEREEFLRGALNMDEETQKVLWLCGVRKQQYFELNDLIFMTFEYKGNDFEADMKKMASYLDSKGLLIKQRRKDVPADQRTSTNWWAPVKSLGTLLTHEPVSISDENEQAEYIAMLDGCMSNADDHGDISYDADEWIESVQIW